MRFPHQRSTFCRQCKGGGVVNFYSLIKRLLAYVCVCKRLHTDMLLAISQLKELQISTNKKNVLIKYYFFSTSLQKNNNLIFLKQKH